MSLIEEIISAVLDRPPLWNSKYYDHKNRLIIKVLWEEIKEKLNIELGELKKKWKNLRDNYRKELKKIPVPRSGDAGSDSKSTCQYFDQMSFLRDEVLPANGDSNLDFTSTEDSSAQIGDEVSDEVETPPYRNDSREEYFDSSPRINADVQPYAFTSTQRSTNSTTTHIEEGDSSSTQQSTNSTLTDHQGEDSTTIQLSVNRYGYQREASTSKAARSRKRKTANDIRAELLELEKKRITLLEKDISQKKRDFSS